MSTPQINLTPDNRSLVEAYQRILDHDPAKWDLYPHLAALLPNGAEQSHIYLQGAWRALERGAYEAAQNLSSAAESVYGRTFRARLIDIELLKRQGQSAAISKKLLEIADIFKQKNLPSEEVKAYKRLAILDPSPAYYQRVMILYTQINNVQKASNWASKLAKMTPSTSLPPKTAQAIEKPNPTEAKSTVSALVPVKQSATLAPKPSQPIEAPVPSLLKPAPSESKIAAPALISKPMQPQLPNIAFGKALWGKYFGDVGEEPPLPVDIDEILKMSCPIRGSFLNRKKIRDTHFLVLVPQTVNGRPLSLKTLGEIIQKPLQGNATRYMFFSIGEYADPPAPKSHWALMSRDVIPGTRGKKYQEQQTELAKLRSKTKLLYEVPTILDAAVCVFMDYIRTGISLYGQDLWTFTRCQEKYNATWQLVIGSSGIFGNHDLDNSGVAALTKFPSQIHEVQTDSEGTNRPQKSDPPRTPEPIPKPSLPASPPPTQARKINTESKQPTQNQISVHTLEKLPDIAFGKALWAKYFGDIGEEPPLPPHIDKILSDPCPMWPHKKVRETHLLVLVPQTVNGKPLTLKTLGELVQKPLQGKPTKYSYFWPGQYTNPPPPKSHWVLMSHDAIPWSRFQTHASQQALVTEYRQKSGFPYEVATILDATICIFMEYFRTGTYLYPWTYTRCQEKYDDNWQLSVGGFASDGLRVNHCYSNDAACGIAVLWNFSNQINEVQTTSEWTNRPGKIDSPKTLESNAKLYSTTSILPAPVHKKSTESKQQNSMDNQIALSQPGKISDIVFGKALWAKYFGDVGEEPPLPPDIEKILSEPCHIQKEGKKVRDTHMLVLVPQTVNGQPLTLKTLGDLVQKPLQGNAIKYNYIYLGEYKDLPALKSHWALMSRDVIPGSSAKSYQQHALVVSSLREKTKLPYEVPTLLDAATCIFMEYFRTGTYLYGRNPLTYTRCQEKYDGIHQLAVGSFSPGGLSVVRSNYYVLDCLGVAVIRKFF